MRGRLRLLLVLAAPLGLVGCNSAIGTVRGKVYYNGTLLKGGTVTFVCADGRAIPTGIREDGTYVLEQVPVGNVKICVDTSSLSPKSRKGYAYEPPPGAKAPSRKSQEYVEIPGKYADPAQSGLTFAVKGGRQDHDVKLE